LILKNPRAENYNRKPTKLNKNQRNRNANHRKNCFRLTNRRVRKT